MKTAKTMYYAGLGLSLLVGVWHFFVPAMFQWYAYIPGEYENLIVGIDWTNFFFSFLLTGLSLLLILRGKTILAGSKEALVFYGLSTCTWFFRVLITFIVPWPLEPIAWAAYGQQIGAFVVFVLHIVPFIVVWRAKRRALL